MGTPVNILMNGRSILKWFENAKISMTESGYCFAIDLTINSLEIWDWFDPEENKGKLSIEILIGSDSYKFLCEERTAPIQPEGTTFTIWGRSKQALLDKPYSRLIKDTIDTDHPWQDRNVSVKEIIDYILDNYTPGEVSVLWNVENFLVYQGTFSVSDRSPIEVIASLAEVVGGQLVPDLEGNLSIEIYQTSGSPITTFDDENHLLSLTEETKHSFGYNAITILGQGADVSNQLSYEILTDEDERSSWEINKPRTVRVYYFHIDNLRPVSATVQSSVVARSGSSGVISTAEVVPIIFGSGSTSKFDLDGNSSVIGDNKTPLELRSVSYQTRYVDFSVSVSNYEDNYVLFYFTDKTASSLLTIKADENNAEKECSSLSIESILLEDDPTRFEVRIYGKQGYIKDGFDIGGESILIPSSIVSEKISEFIVFSKGVGNTSKPIFSSINFSFPGRSLSGSGSYSYGSTEIKFGGYSKEYIGAFVEYTTQYMKGIYSIPRIYLIDPEKYPSYSIYFETDCGFLSTSVSTDGLKQDENHCDDLSIEFVGNQLRIYGDINLVSSIKDMYGTSLVIPSTNKTEKVTDNLTFSEGKASLSKPYWSGTGKTVDGYNISFPRRYYKDVSISEKTNPHIAVVTYTTVYFYHDFINVVDGYTVFVKTICGGILSASLSSSDKDNEEVCPTATLEVDSKWSETNGIETSYSAGGVPSATGRRFHFTFNGDPSIITKKFCSSGSEVFLNPIVGRWEEVFDDLTFTDGKASLSKPLYQDLKLTPTTFNTGSFSGYNCKQYFTEVVLDEYTEKYIFARASYKTYYYEGYTDIPTTFKGELKVFLETKCGELLTVSTNVEDLFDSEYRRVVINVKDYTSDVNVAGAEVYIDGTYRGTTLPDGTMEPILLKTGDHRIRIVAPGYMNSEDDELANETFKVE